MWSSDRVLRSIKWSLWPINKLETFSWGLYRQPKLSGAPDDTDGLSPSVTSYSRTWSWENETLYLNSSFLPPPDLLCALALDDREAFVEDLLLLNMDSDNADEPPPTPDELRHDLSVKSVDTRRIGETAAEAVKVESMSNASGIQILLLLALL